MRSSLYAGAHAGHRAGSRAVAALRESRSSPPRWCSIAAQPFFVRRLAQPARSRRWHGRAGGAVHRRRLPVERRGDAARARRGVLRLGRDVHLLPAARALRGNVAAAPLRDCSTMRSRGCCRTSALRLRGSEAERVTPDELRRRRPRARAAGRARAGGRAHRERQHRGRRVAAHRRIGRRACASRGDELTAGTLNLTGGVEMRVTRVGQDSTLAAMSRLLERAQGLAAARSPISPTASPPGSSPACCCSPWPSALYWAHADPARAFPTVLAVLVVTCPCALSLGDTGGTRRRHHAPGARRAAGRPRPGAREPGARRPRRVRQDRHADARRAAHRKCRHARATPAGGACLALAAALGAPFEHPLARAFAAV